MMSNIDEKTNEVNPSIPETVDGISSVDEVLETVGEISEQSPVNEGLINKEKSKVSIIDLKTGKASSNKKIQKEKKISEDRDRAMKDIISFLELASSRGTFKLEESYNIWNNISNLMVNDGDSISRNKSFSFLHHAVKISCRRGAFELDECGTLLKLFEKFT